jgi:hypothetical protein
MMTVLNIFLLLLLTLIVCILFLPVRLEIDSNREIFRITMTKAISFHLLIVDNEPAGRLKIFFWKKLFRLTPQKPKERREKIKTENSAPRKKFPLRKIVAALKSFRIKRLLIHFDTGDMAINGKLFPLFYALSYVLKRDIAVNFAGENQISVEIENNIARTVWSFVRH